MKILTYDKKSLGSRLGKIWNSEKIRIPLLFLLFLLPFMLSAEYLTHKVAKGENLYRLHLKYGVSVDQIKELNNLADDTIHVGQVLKIKKSSTEKPSEPSPKPKAQEEQKPAKPAPTEAQKETEPRAPVRQDLPDDYYYTVQKSEGLYRIAVNHGITLKELETWNEIDSKTHTIHIGEKLIIKDPSGYSADEKSTGDSPVPAVDDKIVAAADTVVVERIYVVQKGDTLFGIAKENGMTVDELKERNSLSSNDIKVGQLLWLVGNPPDKSSSQTTSSSSSGSVRTDLFMPTQGRVTSEFGMRKGRAHKGIDIANKSGTPIYAALDGVVVFSGVQRGYGNVILIEHPNFVITVYAHNEKNLVKVNDKVNRGQHIANMGSTGNSTGPHLHFEYRVKGTAINPRKVLPF